MSYVLGFNNKYNLHSGVKKNQHGNDHSIPYLKSRNILNIIFINAM